MCGLGDDQRRAGYIRELVAGLAAGWDNALGELQRGRRGSSRHLFRASFAKTELFNNVWSGSRWWDESTGWQTLAVGASTDE